MKIALPTLEIIDKWLQSHLAYFCTRILAGHFWYVQDINVSDDCWLEVRKRCRVCGEHQHHTVRFNLRYFLRGQV